MNILQELTKSLYQVFTTDLTRPGVTISMIDSDEYYTSIVRYSEAFGKGKFVFCSALGPTIEQSIRKAAVAYINKMGVGEGMKSLCDVLN